MTTFDNDSLGKLGKISEVFCCKICDYTTCLKYNFKIHLKSIKHKNNETTTNNNELLGKISKKYECENCEKGFNDRAGLWRHNKKCKIEEKIEHIKNDEPSDKELIVMLLKQNSQLIDKNCELSKNACNNSHNTTTNSHNKAFNLQFFLNETCKDAMNIMDFVDSIKLQLSDLEKVGQLGYVEGISNIITTNLKALDVTQRPIHCTDKKRETLYIKDEDKWEKEDDEKKKLRNVIKKVASKNQRLLPQFKEAHPDCNRASSKFSDQYNKIIVESMGGSGDNDLEKEDKIIKKITTVTTIDKEI